MEHHEELEELVRTGLRERAGRVDTTAPVVAAARRTVRRRRGLRAAGASAVGVAAVVIAAAIAVDTGPDPAGEPAPGTTATGGIDPAAPAADAWRTEYWRDVAVDVPADWTWGPAPQRLSGGPHICGDPPGTAYVGRPIFMSDLCRGGDYVRKRSAPYVWLGADVAPGTVDLGDGFVQETVEVAGTVVTVATADEALRARILATVTRSPTHCAPDLEGVAPARR